MTVKRTISNAQLPKPRAGSGVAQTVYDVDLDDAGRTLFAVGYDRASHLVFGVDRVVALPGAIVSPRARLIRSDYALVADRRVLSDKEKNAYVITDQGVVVLSFPIGDGVADILRTRNFIVVTYFDEGIYSGIGPSWNGLAVFDLQGQLLWGWNDDIAPRRGAPIDDCYAVVGLGEDQIAMVS